MVTLLWHRIRLAGLGITSYMKSQRIAAGALVTLIEDARSGTPGAGPQPARVDAL